MRFITTLLLALALLASPASAAPATLAQPMQRNPPLTTSLHIVEPGSSPLVVFSLVYTATLTWPETTTVTVTTTLPPWMIVTSIPGCTRVDVPIGVQIGCAWATQADQPIAVALRFAVPWDIRGKVAISSTATDGSPGSVTARTSFSVPPQYRLPLVLR